MMRNGRNGPIPSDLGDLVDELDDIQRRLRIVEAPSGEALSSTVAKLRALVEDIQAQLNAWAATRWTNDQIDARILALIASHMAGNVSIGGSLTVQGAVVMPGVRGTDLTSASNRVTVWQAGPTDNRLGHT